VAEHLTEKLREDLLARWSEAHRKHHTVTHLHEMLDSIGLLAEAGAEFDREAVELAAWFHDAIYEIGRDDNAERSAELARDCWRHHRSGRRSRGWSLSPRRTRCSTQT
jgi:predicted metal-dependent HD superfamily phosphohydrolase